jgi:hypothetical protein
MTRVESQLQQTAVHEAGHAVIIVVQCRRFGFVEIGDASHILGDGTVGTRLGRIHHEPDEFITPRQETMELWGGVCAERLLKPHRSWLQLILNSGLADLEEINRTMKEFPRDRTIPSEDELIRATTQLLKENWQFVMAVVNALLERKRLFYYDVMRLLLQGFKSNLAA